MIASPLVITEAVKLLSDVPAIATAADPVAKIRGGLSVSQIRNASVLDLRYRSSNADDCPKVLQALVDTYSTFLLESETDVSGEVVSLITKGRDELNQKLDEEQARHDEFRLDAPLIWKDGQAINIYRERQANIESRRAALLLSQSELRARIKTVEDAIVRGVQQNVVHALAHSQQASSRDTHGQQ